MEVDKKMSFVEYLRRTTEKVSKVTVSQSRLMRNLGGPTAIKKTYNCYQLYLPLPSRDIGRNTAKRSAHRKNSMSAVSEPVVVPISGVIPIDLLMFERKTIYERKKAAERSECHSLDPERIWRSKLLPPTYAV